MKKAIFVLAALLIVASGCSKEDKTIIIADQYGLAYAPIQVMKGSGILEEMLGEDYTVQWVKLANMAAIREAMVGDSLDVGFMGIPPFLIGVDNDMEWKIMGGLSEAPLGLVVSDPDIKSLEDLIGKGKIALPQPGSIQHILLSMTAKDQLQDATVFDQQLVSMKHPDGMMALGSSDEVIAHYTSPPYLFMELEDDNNQLLTVGTDGTKGDFTFIVGVCRESFYNHEAYDEVMAALEESIALIRERDEATLELLADSYDLDRETLMSYLYHEDMEFGTQVKGIEKFIDFMLEVGYIKEHYEEAEVIW